jgi:citrate synthase
MNFDAAGRRLLSTDEVADRLGVKTTTIYAYVSRGLITPVPTESRGSWFDPADVEAMAQRARRGDATPGPVIESRLTLLEDGVVRYRGVDALRLSREATFEEVAHLLWSGERPQGPVRAFLGDPDARRRAEAAVRLLPPGAWPIDQLRLVAAVAAASDPLRLDVRPEAVPGTGAALIGLCVDALPMLGDVPEPDDPIARRLWARLTTRRPFRREVAVLDATLVLLADHELAGSTFAARIAASFGADPTAVVGAGLGPMSGPRHGAASVSVEELLAEAEETDPDHAVAAWLRHHDRLPGFGHPVHRGGDPRAVELLARVREVGDGAEVLELADHILARAAQRAIPPPNIDFALGVLVRLFRMRPAAGEGIFAVARMAGWLAHAQEEYERPSSLRPRARYVGVNPDLDSA